MRAGLKTTQIACMSLSVINSLVSRKTIAFSEFVSEISIKVFNFLVGNLTRSVVVPFTHRTKVSGEDNPRGKSQGAEHRHTRNVVSSSASPQTHRIYPCCHWHRQASIVTCRRVFCISCWIWFSSVSERISHTDTEYFITLRARESFVIRFF